MFSTRTHIARGLVAALVTASGFVMNGCGSPTAPQKAPVSNPNPAPQIRSTGISGSAGLRPGSAGDLGNSMVAIYSTLQEWANYMPVAYASVSGGGAQVSFDLTDIVPGVYYLDIWKDVDNSQTWSVGDFVGWFGNGALGAPSLTPLMVTQGQTRSIGNLSMYLIGNYAQASKAGDTDR